MDRFVESIACHRVASLIGETRRTRLCFAHETHTPGCIPDATVRPSGSKRGPSRSTLCRHRSDYARDHPGREDIAESFLPYLAVRYRSARISRSYEGTIVETMPNRIAYFDRLLQTQPDNPKHPITADLRQSLSFAHFGNGGSITSDLVLVNLEPSASYPAIYFYDPMGDLIDPESVVDLTEDLEVREDRALTVRTGIEPLGELVISTHGRGELVTGSVTVFSDIVRS